MLADHSKGLKTQMTEQSRKHAPTLEDLKQTQSAIHSLFTQKNTFLSPVQDYNVTVHFTSMTKASDIMFDGKPDNWPIFENQLIREAEKTTI
jgi:hypothetical protein